jgi:hypothetical protein
VVSRSPASFDLDRQAAHAGSFDDQIAAPLGELPDPDCESSFQLLFVSDLLNWRVSGDAEVITVGNTPPRNQSRKRKRASTGGRHSLLTNVRSRTLPGSLGASGYFRFFPPLISVALPSRTRYKQFRDEVAPSLAHPRPVRRQRLAL